MWGVGVIATRRSRWQDGDMSGTHAVIVVAFDGAQLLDLAGPLDVLDATTRALAGQAEALLAGDYMPPPMARDIGYQVRVATPGGAPVRTSSGLLVVADAA